MRLSAEQGSPYYVGHELERRRADFGDLTLTIDGIQREDVVEASEEEGWALIIARDPETGAILDMAPNGEGTLYTEVRGVVQFHWTKERVP
jgi:hypothetical protein